MGMINYRRALLVGTAAVALGFSSCASDKSKEEPSEPATFEMRQTGSNISRRVEVTDPLHPLDRNATTPQKGKPKEPKAKAKPKPTPTDEDNDVVLRGGFR